VRKWKKASDFKETDWIYEVGEAPVKQDEAIKPSNVNVNR